jgi:hypothetical protein
LLARDDGTAEACFPPALSTNGSPAEPEPPPPKRFICTIDPRGEQRVSAHVGKERVLLIINNVGMQQALANL